MKYLKLSIIAFFCAASLISCSKDDETQPQIKEKEGFLEGTNWVPARVKKISDYVYLDEKYDVVYVVNLPAPDVGNKSTEGHRPIGFNFDTREAVYSDTYNNTDGTQFTDFVTDKAWHFYMSDIYNSTIVVDSDSPNREEGKGKIRVLDILFDDLTEADEKPLIFSNLPVSMDKADPIRSWGYYFFQEHVLYTHEQYTLLFHLKDDRYAKMQFIDLYKDNPATPPKFNDPDSKNLAPFLNFRYYIQKTSGNRNLKTK